MRCLFIFLNLLVLITHVASLGISVQPQTLVGTPSLVIWTRDDTDPASMTFDLRFVQGDADVGLAVANVDMEVDDFFGTVYVTFPVQGQYVLKAVTGSLGNTVVGASNQITAVGLNPPLSSSSASASASPSSSSPTSVTSFMPTTTPSSSSASTSNTASPIPTLTRSSSSSGAATPSASSSTSNPPPNASTTPNNPPQSPQGLSKAANRRNVGAIIGGVLGGTIILAFLVLLFVLLGRRRDALNRRLTFHRDMMVQPRLRILSLASRPRTLSDPESGVEGSRTPTTSTGGHEHEHEHEHEGGLNHLDPEHGLLPRPLGSGHIVPSPKGPRPSLKRATARAVFAPATPTPVPTHDTRTVTTLVTPRTPNPPAPLRTRRQKQLADRIRMLSGQIEDVQTGVNGIGIGSGSRNKERTDEERARVLEEMQREMVWLRDHEQSAWAMGLTDVLPPGHARYMTP